MDPITSALRAMYEEFPYPPAAAPEQRSGSDVNLLLSYGKRRPTSKKLTVLDAGCGRGAGLLGAAILQPNVRFVGADINRVALEEARQQAKARGITNVSFHEVDLTTLEGLEIPSAGYDVIFSSGVVHHMPDPNAALAKLSSVLAPHGMLQLMVYATRGREPLYRMARAMDRLLPRTFPLRDRLMVARLLSQSVTSDAISCGTWGDIKSITDIELVDRYLNVNERSYDIPQLFDLIEVSALRFVRWSEPQAWDLAAVIRNDSILELAGRLAPREQYALVEEIAWRPKFELVLCAADNEARSPLPPAEVPGQTLAMSQEVSFNTEVRRVNGQQQVEQLSVRVRRNPPIVFEKGFVASAVLFLRDLTTSHFQSETLINALTKSGVPASSAHELIAELLKAEILYRPHS